MSILFFVLAVLIFLLSLSISVAYNAQGPDIVAGIGLSSIFCDIGSMAFSLIEIVKYDSYKKITRNMIFLQIAFILLFILF